MIVKDKGLGFLPIIMAALEVVKEDSTFTLEADPNATPAAYQQARPKLSRGATVGLAVGGAALLGTLMLVLARR